MATSINYSSTAQTGKNLSKSITDINPDLSNATIKTFTQKLNALTTNSLGAVNRVDKTEIDTSIVYYDLVWEPDQFGLPEGVTFDGSVVSITANYIKTMSGDIGGAGFVAKVNNISFAPPDTYSVVTANNPGADLIAYMNSGHVNFDVAKKANPKVGASVSITIPAGKYISGGTAYNYNASTLTAIITE